MLRCRARGEHESHGLPRQIRADSIHRITALHRTQRAEIDWEAGGACGGTAMGRGYFSPCASGSAELDRAVYPQLHPRPFLCWSKQVCGSSQGSCMHWRWVQRTEACAFSLLQPRDMGNSSTRKTNTLGKTNTSQFFLNSCFP